MPKLGACAMGVIVLFIILLIVIFSDLLKLNANSGFLSSRTEGYGGAILGTHGTHKGDAVGEEELYLSKYDHMMEGIDPEIQASQDEYVKEQDMVVVSRGAAGPHATEVDHLRPPNVLHGLTGFRQFWHDTYTLPDARQMPSDDPGQFYSTNPTGYVIGAAL